MSHDWFWSFWWLIFPIMGFLLAAFRMWMRFRAYRVRMELFKTYAAQGRSPDELAKLMAETEYGPAAWSGHWRGSWGPDVVGPGAAGPGAWGPGVWGPGVWGYGRWGYGRWGYWGPYREWRRVVIFACLAVGFGLGSRYADLPHTAHAFTLVAIIMSVLTAGSLVMAIVATLISTRTTSDAAEKKDG
jgi:hypothetical protein